MTDIRRMLVQVDTDKACESRVAFATKLADRYGAELEGVFARGSTTIPAMFDASAPVALLDAYQVAVDGVVKRAKARFEDALAAANASAPLHTPEGPWNQALTRHAHKSDLIVLGQHNTEDDEATSPASLVGDVVMSAGRPALVVPYIGASADPVKTVLLCWKDSREATRAVKDAMPLMAGAKIHVLAVNPPDDTGVTGEEATDYLKAHGLDATYDPSHNTDIPVADVILSRAADIGAQMIVMGAYSHSRWRETVMGGVTRDLLHHMTVPVLMSR